MSSVHIYGMKGKIIAKPFQVNTAEDDPEPIGEEEKYVNFLASDSDNTESTEVADDTKD